MVIGRDEIVALTARELALIEDPARCSALAAILVEPRVEEREWLYSRDPVRYPYWVVAESVEQKILLVYCEQGFGPSFPWGVLYTGDHPMDQTLGMDAQWNWYLEEAFWRSGLWDGPTKPGFEEAFHQSPEERFGV